MDLRPRIVGRSAAVPERERKQPAAHNERLISHLVILFIANESRAAFSVNDRKMITFFRQVSFTDPERHGNQQILRITQSVMKVQKCSLKTNKPRLVFL